jgi:hypothetical protein
LLTEQRGFDYGTQGGHVLLELELALLGLKLSGSQALCINKVVLAADALLERGWGLGLHNLGLQVNLDLRNLQQTLLVI